MSKLHPKVSVVTINLNQGDALAATLESILHQTYPGIELIVIDGGSRDQSLQVIEKHKDRITNWVSEPDRGIYHAMNKGLARVTGDWVIFMNAGDCFFSPDVVERIFGSEVLEADVLYGDCEVRYENGFKRVQAAYPVEQIWRGMICSHQSAFIRSAVAKDFGFNETRRTAADFEMLYRAYHERLRFLRVNVVISSVSAGGLSDRRRTLVLREYWRILAEHGRSTKYAPYYALRFLGMEALMAIRALLPKPLLQLAIESKYKLRVRHPG